MPAGKVKWFNNAKGYGFVIAEGSEEDLFAHFSSIQMEGYKTLKAGQAVAFDTVQVDKGIHAVNIVPCNSIEEAENKLLAGLSESIQSETTVEEEGIRAVN
jgi:CspA family cold shock protein